MSSHTRISRISVPELARRKGPGSIVSLTAYSTPMARWVDAQADLIIVGDSLGMVLYGLPSTLGVSLEMMIAHGQAVMRGSERACVAVDLPFGSYQASPEQAFHAAARVLQETGAAAVKLEAGEALAETVAFLVQRGVPVLAHVGLMPQQVNVLGGFKAQGLDAAGAERVRRDALAMQAAGAFAVVLEGIAEPLARQLSEELAIPTIGIGASPACDGQVLVTEDALGLFGDYQPRFIKRYAALAPSIEQALAAYAEDVRQGRFPELRHCFGVKTMVG
ncbi:3-methyl-2-oxobutanoate hydroxymethyltransferase [Pseudomonas sp. 1D4]|uniref:3-methyl-2-oxobutanoate hydroxymethyltransferase n=1 Tax=Pseudomonadaceae TaxID=135621 RepID=UPI00084A5A37|nr:MULTISPECIES: 3-methyl-2-oxobutanoate hydroxymethyltransferase [Pseudomonas]OEC39565.1 3-methyl-2-oxobutanoate hydroxymethyltransferase [Pseudomonas sp. 1D4]OEC59273.1 3-methyl-2-oxobutanoate hydroxymethyltransferase [Pseudomonas sp. ENNP23]